MARPGRPPKPFFADDDRYLVALMEAFLRRFRINGRVPSIRQTAERAVLVHEFNLQGVSRHRRSPAVAPPGGDLRP